jgi:hypothetical protein
VKKVLNIWPVIPIVIHATIPSESRRSGVTTIIAALNQRNRILCEIGIENIPNSLLNKLAAMKKTFPVLTYLHLFSYDKNEPVLPDSFLGRCVERKDSLKAQQ